MYNNNWVDVSKDLPKVEGYYDVKYFDGEEDSKPFRIRPKNNIYGFMTEKEVTHWRNNTDKQDFEID
jgi:hypothetical protein